MKLLRFSSLLTVMVTAAIAGGQNLLEGIETMTVRREPFVHLGQLEAKLPIGVLWDESGMIVLRTLYDCVPVYVVDSSEVMIRDSTVYVNAKIAAQALGCRIEKKRSDVRLVCERKLDTTRVGSAVGERAPGFRLFSEDSTLVTLDSLRERGPIMVLFVRSAEWDPTSKELLLGARQKLDSLRGGGFSVAAIHGYESRFAKRWADSLKLDFTLLSDRFSAVMRGYEVFDRGNLPYPTLFVVDERGIIRLRREWREYGEVVNWGEIMKAISEER